MKLSKLMFSTTLIALLAANPLYAKEAKSASLTSAEKNTLATVAAIDKNEIIVSVVASNKKTDSGVADFAKMMIDQHGGNLTQILELLSNFHVATLSSAEADKFSAQGKKEMFMLGELEGNKFDVAYVNAMVTGHQAVLDLIDNRLMKTATTEEVKKFMEETRAAVAKHLEHAKKLQEEMKA